MTIAALPTRWVLPVRSSRRVQPPVLSILLAFVLLLTIACGGSDDDGDDADAADDGASGAGSVNTAQQLFADRGCAECHGAEGEGTGDDPRTVIMGTRLIIQQFEIRVRNGKGSAMPGATEAQLSDEEMRTLYDWLTGR